MIQQKHLMMLADCWIILFVHQFP